MNSIQEQKLSQSFDNKPLDSVDLASRAVHLATEMHRAAFAFDWIRAEHFARRLETVVGRIKFDSRNHQITLESEA